MCVCVCLYKRVCAKIVFAASVQKLGRWDSPRRGERGTRACWRQSRLVRAKLGLRPKIASSPSFRTRNGSPFLWLPVTVPPPPLAPSRPLVDWLCFSQLFFERCILSALLSLSCISYCRPFTDPRRPRSTHISVPEEPPGCDGGFYRERDGARRTTPPVPETREIIIPGNSRCIPFTRTKNLRVTRNLIPRLTTVPATFLPIRPDLGEILENTRSTIYELMYVVYR